MFQIFPLLYIISSVVFFLNTDIQNLDPVKYISLLLLVFIPVILCLEIIPLLLESVIILLLRTVAHISFTMHKDVISGFPIEGQKVVWHDK